MIVKLSSAIVIFSFRPHALLSSQTKNDNFNVEIRECINKLKRSKHAK